MLRRGRNGLTPFSVPAGGVEKTRGRGDRLDSAAPALIVISISCVSAARCLLRRLPPSPYASRQSDGADAEKGDGRGLGDCVVVVYHRWREGELR